MAEWWDKDEPVAVAEPSSNQNFWDQDEEVVQSTGQSYAGALGSSAARGAVSLGSGIVSGLGALGEVVGLEDNALIEAGEGMRQNEEDAFPVNPIFAQSFPVKAAGAAGQAASQLGIALGTGGLGLAPSVARGTVLGVGALMGAGGGRENAEQYGITDPVARAATILLGGAAEAGTEMIGGIGGSRMTNELLGNFPEQIAKYYGLKRAAETIASEAGEEALSGAITDTGVMALAPEDPNREGFATTGAELPSLASSEFYKNRLEEAALGAVGGTVFAGYQAAFNRPDTAEAIEWRQKANPRIVELQQNAQTLTPEQQQELSLLTERDADAKRYIQKQGADIVQQGIMADPESAAFNMSAYYQRLSEAAKDPEEKTEFANRALFWSDQENVRNLADLADGYAQLNEQMDTLDSNENADPAQIIALQQQIDSHPLHKENNLSVANQEKVIGAMQAFRASQKATAEVQNDPVDLIANETADEVESFAPEVAQILRENVDENVNLNTLNTFNELLETPIPQQETPLQELQTGEVEQIQPLTQNEPINQESLSGEQSGGQLLPESRELPVLPEQQDLLNTEVESVSIDSIAGDQGSQGELSRPVQRGVTAQSVNEGVKRLSGIISNIADTTWSGNASGLASNEQFRSDYVSEYQAGNPNSTPEQAQASLESFLAAPIAQGINLRGRNYLLNDNIEVTGLDQSRANEHGGTAQEWATVRTLLHENWHTASNSIKSQDSELKSRFTSLADQITPEELDDIASRRYQEFSNWRENTDSKDSLVDEWMAERMEGVTVQTMPAPDTLLGRLVAWYKQAYAKVVGLQPKDVRDEELLAMFDAWRTGGISTPQNYEKTETIAESEAENNPPKQNEDEVGIGQYREGDESMVESFPERNESRASAISFERTLRDEIESEDLKNWTEERIQAAVDWVESNQEGERPFGWRVVNRLLAEQAPDADAELARQSLAQVREDAKFERDTTDKEAKQAIARDIERSPVQESRPENIRRAEDQPLEVSGEASEEAYKEVTSSNAPPEYKEFVQVLGKQVNKPTFIQKVKPLVAFARGFLDSNLRVSGESLDYGDSSEPPITPENTRRVRRIWEQVKEGPEFAQQYLERFREQAPKDASGEALHKGAAAVGVLQMEMMDYARRLAATANFKGKVKGSTRHLQESRKLDLAKQMESFANDIVVGDYMTVSNAARALQVRSMATRQQGFWQTLKLIRQITQSTATGKGQGEKRYNDLLEALNDPDVGANVPAELEKWLTSSEVGKQILEALERSPEQQLQRAEEQFMSSAMEEALELLDDRNKATLGEILSDLQQLRDIDAAIARYENKAPVQESTPSMRPIPNSIEGLKAQRAILQERISKNLDTFRKQTKTKATSKKDSPVKTIEEEAKALVKRLNEQKPRNKKPESPLRKAFTDQIKNPKSKDDFTASMEGLGVSEDAASAMFDLASRRADLIQQNKRASEKAKEARDIIKAQEKELRDFERDEKAEELKIKRAEQKETDEAVREAKQLRKDQESRRKAFEAKEAAAREKVEKLLAKDANAPTDLAASIIDQIDKQNTEWKPSDPKKSSELIQIKKAALLDERTDRDYTGYLDKARFIEYYQPSIEAAGVKPSVARALAERLYFENVRLKSNAFVRERQRIADSKGFLRSLAEDILSNARSSASDSDTRKEWLKNAFMSRGLTEEKAGFAADAMEVQLTRRFNQARVEALQKAAKELGVKTPTVESLTRAIRADLFNPNNPIAEGLAREAGYAPLSDADYSRLAQLDELMKNAGATEASKYITEMLDVIAKTRPPKGMLEMIARSYVPTVLGGLSTQGMTWTASFFSVLHKVGVDLAGLSADAVLGKVKATQAVDEIGLIVDSFISPWKAAIADARFSFKNQAFAHRQQIHLQQVNSMSREFRDAKRDVQESLKSGNRIQTAKAMVKYAYAATDLIRVSMSAADQTWGGFLREYTLRSQSIRALLREAKLSVTDAKTILMASEKAGIEQAEKRSQEIENADPALKTVMARDYANEFLIDAVNETVEAQTGGKGVGDQLRETAQREADLEIGTRRGEQGFKWDIPNILFELAKEMSASTKRKNELLGHILTGFVTTPANLLDRSLYFTPWGLLRTYWKAKANSKGEGDKMYNETMATRQQMRLRKIEGVAGSLGMLILWTLMAAWKDDEGEPIMSVTGYGPQDKAQREAWLKQGNKPNALQIKLGGKIIQVPYGRGGFEGMNIPLAAMGAVDDMDLNMPNADKATAEWIGQYIGRAAIAVGTQASFLSPKNIVGSITDAQASTKGVASNAAWIFSSFIPFSTTLKSASKALITGPQDTSSTRAAVLTQIPIVGTFVGRSALNLLGDKLGGEGDDWWTKTTNRSWYAGLPIGASSMGDGPRSDVYGYIADTGIAPTAPNRRTLEQKNGFVDDDRWQTYVKLRGRLIVDKMRDRMSDLRSFSVKEADRLMSRISADSTAEAKEQLNLK